jgi:hypothetical protein
MHHIDCSDVTSFLRCQLNNVLIMSSSPTCVLTAYNQIPKVTHVRNTGATSVMQDITLCYTLTNKVNRMTQGRETITHLLLAMS